MSSNFSTTAAPINSVQFGPSTNPTIASAATNSGNLTEKSLELTFCSQFSAEIAFYYHFPWPHRIVWFGLTQLQESQLGFDAATSLGGRAIVFQFKASHTVVQGRGRRFKVEHNQMEILRSSFANHPGCCFYVFPDVGNIADLAAIQSDVIGHSWLVDVAALPNPIPLPYKHNTTSVRRDNCHFAYLGQPSHGQIEFHSQPFAVQAYKAKEFARKIAPRRGLMSTEMAVAQLNRMEKESLSASRMFSRNTVMAILPDEF